MRMEINEIFNMYFGIIKDKRDPYTIKHKLNRYIEISYDISIMWYG